MGTSATSPSWHEIALEKLTKVLGEQAATRVMRETLAELKLAELTSADDLNRFGRILSARPGFAGAVGGLLSATAVMRGAGTSS